MIRINLKNTLYIPLLFAAFAAGLFLAVNQGHTQPARQLFAAKPLPTTQSAAAYGFYSKGCLAGGVAIANDGPTWQAMRPSRNRRWGHPKLVALIQKLSVDAKKYGWNGVLVGDMSQPRGGPVKGHASHQIGLDADIWLRQMPNRRFSRQERNKTSSTWMLKKGTPYVNNNIWTKAHEGFLKTAASYKQVDRLFVHAGIKKKLCDTVRGNRSWLGKVRPYWGHQSHFHLRMKCQAGLGKCKKQAAIPAGTGCDKSLEWWFKVAYAPKKKVKKPKIIVKKKKKKKKVRRYKTMADLPPVCRVVLNGPGPVSLASVIYKPGGRAIAAVKPAVSTKAVAIAASAGESPAAKAARSVVKKTKSSGRIAIPTRKPDR